MGVVIQSLSPGMQHSGDADPGTKPFRIGGNGRECLGRHFEQQAVDQRLVLVRDRTQLGRQREHHVEVGDGQQLGCPSRQPCACGGSLALGAVAGSGGGVGGGGGGGRQAPV